MNIQKLKSIVNDLEQNNLLLQGSKPATADLVVMFSMAFDRWLVDTVKDLGGDTSMVIRNNETALEMALADLLHEPDDSEFHVDYVSEMPIR